MFKKKLALLCPFTPFFSPFSLLVLGGPFANLSVYLLLLVPKAAARALRGVCWSKFAAERAVQEGALDPLVQLLISQVTFPAFHPFSPFPHPFHLF